MKLNNLLLVSIFLLALITFGAVSAADDNAASITDIEGDLDIEVQSVDEIDADGGVDSDAAICDDVTQDDDKLGAIDDSDVIGSSDDDKLSGDVSPKYNLTVNLPMSGSAYVAQWGQPIGVTLDMGNATGEVTMTFADQTYTVPLVNGVATYEITKYSKISNNQKLNIAYGGDDYYASFSTSKNIHIKLDELVANSADYGQTPYVEVNLYNATGNVTFTVNGNTYRKELVNGTAVQEFTDYVLGRNTVAFAYEGDENYNPISKSVNFNANANIEAPTIYNFQPAIIKVYLGEATGQVIMSMGSEEYTVDVIKGVATQEFENYVVGSNKVTVQYSGDDVFNPFSTTKTFTVLDKENATILSSVYKTADKNMVIVCIPFGTGNVNVTINGKQEVLELVDGIAIYNINATDVINEINVTYDGNFRLNGANSSEFKVLDNVVNAENYMYYFNQADGGKIFGFIEDGTTLDFQGSIINPDQAKNIFFDVSKPVNIISTTNDAYIDLNTTAGSLMGENPGNRFTISYGGSGTNMTGINFHNTQLWLFNTHHVVLDRVSNVIEDQRVGSGVGATSIRANSTWVTVKNSYFYTRNNGGSSSLVIAWADYCTFHNNTIRVEGQVGNMIYLTTYNVEIPQGVTPNAHNNITNNRIFGPEKAAAICWGFVVAGSDNLFANNWINYTGVGFNAQWGMGDVEANIYVNNTLIGGASANFPAGSIAYNNYISGTMSTGADSVVYNNTVGKVMTVGAGAEAYNNTAGGLTMSGAGGIAHDNIINGVTTISQANVVIENNTFLGDNPIKFSNTNAKNGIFANNTVVGYIEFGNKNAKNNTITGNNITTSHNYAIDLKTYKGTETVITDNILNSKNGFGDSAINHKEDDTLVIDNYQDAAADISVSVDPIKVGQNAVFNVVVNETSMTKVTIFVSGKEYSVDLVDGKGTIEVADLAAGTYDVRVISSDKNFGGQNTTTLEVTKNNPTIVVDAPETVECLNYNVTVNVNDATGTVTFTLNGNDTVVTIVNGVAVFTIADLTQGTYDINITYSGDDKYFDNKTNVTINVAKNKNVTIIASDVAVDRIADKFSATFVNYQGVGIANANVTFKIGNETYTAVTDANGMAIISLSLSRGSYLVEIDFKAIEDEFDAASSSAVISVSDMTVLLIDSISTDAITGTLKDIYGNPITNATIVYTIAGGDKLNTTTDGNGSFAVKVDKNGLVTINFEGDEISEPSAFSITLNGIVPETPAKDNDTKKDTSKAKVATKIVAKKKAFKAKVKTKKYTITLKTKAGKAIKKVKVTLKIKGKTYKAKTNAKGKATFKIKKLTKKGKYTAKIKFAGNKNFKAASKKVKITVKK
ncbi:Ig-like domain repeat protein [Methanobrevibacter thaueri]|uniref:Ig-like domain repeat protein n=1 Tax=Methanobrevibacter thaueri TaxID=190975 RepID=UPI003864D35F